MDVGHRPRLKRNSFGGVELWVREFSETPCCDHKIDCDVDEAVKKLKQLLRNKEEREGDRGGSRDKTGDEDWCLTEAMTGVLLGFRKKCVKRCR